MRISCSVCSTTYEVPDPMLAAGRKVRCDKCGHQWVPRPAAPPAPPPAHRPVVEAAAETLSRGRPAEAAAEIPPLPRPAKPLAPELLRAAILIDPDEAPPPPPARRRAGAGVWLGWAASLAVWALVLWAGYTYRAQVMDAWPPSQRLYAALGLGPGS